LDAFVSVGLFHSDPTDAHSASSEIDVDWAWATAVNAVRANASAMILRKTEALVFMASVLPATAM
jgi:hypothetical protein